MISGSFNFGEFYDGQRNTYELSGRFAPIPHVALTFDFEHNDIKNIGEERQNLSTNLYSIGSRLALNPRVQLSTFYQYNSFDKQGRWNIRASWEYMPLSFIYLVFNDTSTDNEFSTIREQQFISKISFVKQF